MKTFLLYLLISSLTIFGVSYGQGNAPMQTTHDYRVTQKDSVTIIGIACRTSNAQDAGPYDIPKLWERFFHEGISSKIPHKISDEIIALYCDYEGDFTKPYSLVIGCPVSSGDELPPGMVVKTIPAGSYALFSAKGEHPKALVETWTKIWQESSFNRTYSGDYELYSHKFSSSPQEVEVFIAIKE